MSGRKPRGLRPEEKELWDRVREATTPMHPAAKKKPATLRDSVERPARPHQPKPIPQFRIGQDAKTRPSPQVTRPDTNALVEAPPRMDKKSYGKLKRGRLRPEARIDLHGMTVAEAHPALNRFILNAHADGKRLVLVITGKGRQSDSADLMPVQKGVLRRQVPHWLQAAPLASCVLQVAESHQRHGGGGAFYVYLRRRN